MRAVRERLRAMYGIPVMEPHGDPLGELVLTVLSQSTNDRNRDVAFLRLRERFDAWEAVRDAPVEEIEEAIRPGGISKVKSVRIKAMLEAIGDPIWTSRGCATRRWPSRRPTCARCPASGARPPPACCCSPTACATCPSTPTSRAWACACTCSSPARPFDRLHDQMLAITPPGAELEFHVNLLRHGRRTCHAQRPACGVCALRRMCPSRRE